MFDKLTENMKFMLMLVVYTGTLAYWAATVEVHVEHNTQAIQETLQQIKDHNDRCERIENLENKMSYELRLLNNKVERIDKEK